MAGSQRFGRKGDTYTDRDGATVSGMSGKGFTAATSRGLLASDVSDLVEIREDNTEAVARAMNRAIASALEEIGLTAEGYAKRLCPVDTGRLRNSITHTTDGRDAYIGTNVEYAPYVEEGTRRAAAQPFLKPAAADHASTYRAILERHLGGAS